ncbi:putative Vacuolar protein sorting-associated protein 9a [Seiridium cardinale]
MPPPESSQVPTESARSPGKPDLQNEPDHDATMSGPTPAKQPDTIVPTKSDATTATTTADVEPVLDFKSEAEHGLKDVTSPGSNPADRNSQPPSSGDLIDLGGDASTTQELGPEPPAKSELKDKGKSPEVAGQLAEDGMEGSVATLKPKKHQYLTIEMPAFVDPTPPTPSGSQPPSRSSSARSKGSGPEPSPTRSDNAYDERRYFSEDEQEGNSRSEIQSIMEQFPEEGGGPDVEEVMSPRLEIASPFLGSPSPQHPPRKSSLEPLAPSIAQQIQELQGLRLSSSSPTSIRSKPKAREVDDQGPPVPPKDGVEEKSAAEPQSPAATIHRPPPPEPEPEPTLPFDFHRFLEQLKNKKADPVARYLKSFLQEFAKRQWMVHEQVKIISDFLAFIANKMAQCDVWREVSDAEFDNAREGMEKLVMNRLYTQTFSPAIPSPQPIPGSKSKRRGGDKALGPGRRGQHQEDVERDEILTQKINIYGWVREEHLDIPPVNDSGKRFLTLAQQGQLCASSGQDEASLTSPELLKIRSYRAPRDKIICVLNCCKVIFGRTYECAPWFQSLTFLGLLKNAKSDTSADSFMPLLIYVVLQSNPDHLVSNVQYILRFRNQEKLGGEAGYYLSSLMGAIQFVENMDRTTLTITDEEFEKNVETAVSAIAEKHRHAEVSPQQEHYSEKTGLHTPGESSSTRPSLDVDPSGTPRRSMSSDQGEDSASMAGLLRSIQRPLSTIGRMFSDEPNNPGPSHSPARTPQPDNTPKLTPRHSTDGRPSRETRQQLSAEEAAARQASAEAAEAQRLHRAEHNNVVETLAGMFPDLDRDIISDVVYQKEGRQVALQ